VRTDELREFPDAELLGRLDETREELFNLRFQHATGQLENYRSLGDIRRDIARIETVLRERELGIEGIPMVSEKTRLRRLRRAERAKESEEPVEPQEPEELEEPKQPKQPKQPMEDDVVLEADHEEDED
jgi:large subunit ribosomal protein L29